jgi:hypothetical protein
VTGPSGCIAAVSELPDKRHWLLVSNFSSGRQVFSIALPKGASGKIFRDVIDSAESPVRDSVQSVQEERLELTLEPYRTRHLLLF